MQSESFSRHFVSNSGQCTGTSTSIESMSMQESQKEKEASRKLQYGTHYACLLFAGKKMQINLCLA